MTDLAIITPSRGRPGMAADLIDQVRRLSHLDIRVFLGVDMDDPLLPEYQALHDGDRNHVLYVDARMNLVRWTNLMAANVLDAPVPPRYLASLGDDHRPRTPGWDRLLVQAIEQRGGTGFAYGNDLYQGAAKATSWVVSADIVRELGWLMLPELVHLFPDDAVMALGQAAGCLTYVPAAIVEHLHPLAGKANWDASYLDSNSRQRYAADGEVFARWQAEGLGADLFKVRKLMGKETLP